MTPVEASNFGRLSTQSVEGKLTLSAIKTTEELDRRSYSRYLAQAREKGADKQGGSGDSQAMAISSPRYIISTVKSVSDLSRVSSEYLKTLWADTNINMKSHATSSMAVIDVEINNVKGQVLKKEGYWEKIHFLFLFSSSLLDLRYYSFSTVVDGSYAPGLGSNPPADSEFTSFEPKYVKELIAYQENINYRLEAYYERQPPSPK